MKNNLLLFLCAGNLLISTATPSGADELIWPIDAPKSVTSTFGEPRPGRFHYGIDLRSGGVTGRKVYALGDGYVSRVRTSPFGYGKVLYLTLDSGRSVVFAHLSGFLPDIEDMLFRTRIKEKTYDVDLWFKPGEYRVAKGQVVAYSGDTGSGAPHLHFEIRDNNNRPLNPLDIGFNVVDTIPPFIDSVVLIPLDNSSTVDGFPAAQWYEPDTLKDSMPLLFGRIGIAVSASDRVNNSSNLLGVYSISLTVDSTMVFSKQYSRISYEFNGCGGLDYLAGSYLGGNGYLSALFRRPGNDVDFYEGNGVVSITMPDHANPHTVTVTARDYAQNTKNYSFHVLYGERPNFITCGYDRDGTIRIEGDYSSGRIDRVELWCHTGTDSWILDRVYPVSDHPPVKQGDGDQSGPRSNRGSLREKITERTTSLFKAVIVAEDSTRSLPCIFGSPIIPRLNRGTGISNNDTQKQDSEQPVITVLPELYHDRILVHIKAPSPLASLPLVALEVNGVVEDGFISSIPVSETSWIASVPLPRSDHTIMRIKASAYDRSLNAVWDIAPLDFTTVSLYAPATVYAPDSLFSLTVQPSALYRPAPVLVDTVDVQAPNGLKRVTKGYRITWGDAPLKGKCSVRLTLGQEPPEGSALFMSSNGKSWGFLSNVRNGLEFTGDIGSSGQVAVLSDTIVPYVKPLEPRPGSSIRLRRPLLKAYIEDKGAGIGGSDSIVMTIDKITVYGEYDYEANTIAYSLHNDLQPGSHTVTVMVTDRVGNTKTSSWDFRVTK